MGGEWRRKRRLTLRREAAAERIIWDLRALGHHPAPGAVGEVCILHTGRAPDPRLTTVVLVGLHRAGLTNTASAMLEWLRDAVRTCATPATCLNVVHFAAVMNAYARTTDYRRAMLLFGSARSNGVRMNTVLCNTAMLCTSWTSALAILGTMLQRPIGASFVSQSTLIASIVASGEHGAWRKALSLSATLPLAVEDGNIVGVHTALLTGYAGGTKWERALRLCQSFKQTKVRATSVTRLTAVSACEKGSQWLSALGLLAGLRSDAIEVVSLDAKRVKAHMKFRDTVLSACGRAVQWAAALRLVPPVDPVGSLGASQTSRGRSEHGADTVTYNAAINACVKARQTTKAMALYEQMVMARISADHITYAMLRSVGVHESLRDELARGV